MSTFSVSGLTTGIDYSALIKGILDAERVPVTRLEDTKSTYNKKISAYDTLSSRLSTLKSAASALKSASSFYAKKVSSSDSSVVDATSSSSASAGTYSITEITQLAQEENEVHVGVSDKTASINTSGGALQFQYTYAGAQATVDVADGTTLEGLRDIINSDENNPGITASIVYDGTDYRLVLKGDENGDTKTIAIDAGTTLNGTNSVDFTSTAFTETKTAQSLNFKVDGITMTRDTNTVSDAIEGVTLTFKKASAAPGESADISVTQDSSSIKSKIEAFVSAYNNVVAYIAQQSEYDTETGESNPLTGDSAARGIANTLSGIISSGVDGLPEDMLMLAQIGINTNYKDGTLTIDSAALEAKLSSDVEGVFNIFSDASEGIAVRIYDYTYEATGSGGIIAARKDGLNDNIKDIENDIDKIERRLSKMEDDLISQFANLEVLLSGLNAQGSYLLSQISSWD